MNKKLSVFAPSRDLSTFFDNLDSFAESPDGVAKLRELILDLAVRGKLVEQDENDEPVDYLLKRIEGNRNETNGRKRKQVHAEPIQPDEIPYELPASWKWVRFCEVATIASNLVKPQAFQHIAHIAPNNIEKATGRLLPYRTVAEDKVRSGNHQFFAGQILYSKIRPNLSKAVVVDFGGLCSADMYPIDPHIDAGYLLKYILSSTFLSMAVKTDTRVAMPKINQTELNRVLVALPPLSEQRRIVSKVDGLMSLCDELESRGTERVRLRERASRSCLDRLVNAAREPVGGRGSCRAVAARMSPTTPGSAGASPSRTTESLASAWQRLSDHFEVLYDTPETLAHLRQSILQLAVQGKLVPQDPNDEPARELSMEELVGRKNLRNGLSLKQTTAETPYRCLQLSALRDGIVDCSGGKPVPLTADKAEPYLIRQGDVFIVRGNGSKDLVGRAGIVNSQPHNVIFPDLFIRSPLDTNRLLPRFFLIVWNSPEMRTQIESAAKTTSGIWKVNQGHIASMTLRVPPPAEQKRIVAKVDQLLSQCDELSARLQQRRSATQELLAATIHQLLDEVGQ